MQICRAADHLGWDIPRKPNMLICVLRKSHKQKWLSGKYRGNGPHRHQRQSPTIWGQPHQYNERLISDRMHAYYVGLGRYKGRIRNAFVIGLSAMNVISVLDYSTAMFSQGRLGLLEESDNR